MKKVSLGLAAVIVLLLGGLAWGGGIVRELEQAMGLDLPGGAQVEHTDTHGGFHGDGELKAVVTSRTQEQAQRFADLVSERWKPLPADPALLREVSRQWEALSQPQNGWWMYRDRFAEQNGGESRGVMQNCTFALLDCDTMTLYVYEHDM